jgi:hypothetical protein
MRLRVHLAVLLVLAFCIQLSAQKSLTPDDAKPYIWEDATICGKVASAICAAMMLRARVHAPTRLVSQTWRRPLWVGDRNA